MWIKLKWLGILYDVASDIAYNYGKLKEFWLFVKVTVDKSLCKQFISLNW